MTNAPPVSHRNRRRSACQQLMGKQVDDSACPAAAQVQQPQQQCSQLPPRRGLPTLCERAVGNVRGGVHPAPAGHVLRELMCSLKGCCDVNTPSARGRRNSQKRGAGSGGRQHGSGGWLQCLAAGGAGGRPGAPAAALPEAASAVLWA